MVDQEIIQYFNDMLARFEELLFHELSRTAHKKAELVGIDFLQSNKVQGQSLSEVIESCIREITAKSIAKAISYSVHRHGILIRFEVENCIHLTKERKLISDGIRPYMCPLANMIGDRIIEMLNYELVQLANIDIDEDYHKCVVKYAAFQSVQNIGQVADWLTF